MNVALDYESYLVDHPPVDMMVAAYFGVRRRRRRRLAPQPGDTIPPEFQQLSAGVRPYESLPPHVKKFLEERKAALAKPQN